MEKELYLCRCCNTMTPSKNMSYDGMHKYKVCDSCKQAQDDDFKDFCVEEGMDYDL